MPIKIKADLKKLKNYSKDVKEKYQEELNSGVAGHELIRLLQDIIRKGISPVNGEGRFEKYSESYREAIKSGKFPGKKISPVSMYLTGEMLGSLRFKKVQDRLYIEFQDEKAAYHQYGKGYLPKRKLLPTGLFDKFNKRITDLLVKALKKALKK
jgi:hypothetical protein